MSSLCSTVLPFSEPAPVKGDKRGFAPILARTGSVHRPLRPVAYDCVKISVVRAGSAILYSEFGEQPVKVGDVVVLCANTLCGVEPEGWVTVTTLYLDTDYLVDQVFWQHAAILADRLEAQDFAEAMYAEPAQILHLGEDRAGMLMPWLDELVALSIVGGFPQHFYRMQALWFSIADVIGPFIKTSTVRVSTTQRATTYPALPRLRRFAPLRNEAREIAGLLRDQPERRWAVADLAEAVHLSSSQVGRVFVDAYGKSPIAYLTMLRAERMAHLLRTTDTPVAVIARKVGWGDSDFAARQFRRNVGVTPSRYRAMSRGGSPIRRSGLSAHRAGSLPQVRLPVRSRASGLRRPDGTRRVHRGACRSQPRPSSVSSR